MSEYTCITIKDVLASTKQSNNGRLRALENAVDLVEKNKNNILTKYYTILKCEMKINIIKISKKLS